MKKSVTEDKISIGLEEQILEYINKNQPEVYFGHREKLSKEYIMKLVSSEHPEDAIIELEGELVEFNIEYISDLTVSFLDELQNLFEEELQEELNTEDEDEIQKFLDDYFFDYICVGLDIKKLLKNTPDITVLLKVYSNYDCACSFDDINESENYVSEVYQRVMNVVKKEDYLMEFRNSYTASLLCFAIETSLEDFLEMKGKLKSGDFKNFIVKEGTTYGFFSSFNGSGSIFEAQTTEDFIIPKEQFEGKYNVEGKYNEYDTFELIADMEQSYSMDEVYGGAPYSIQGVFGVE